MQHHQTQDSTLPTIKCFITDQLIDQAQLLSSMPNLPECGGFVQFDGYVREWNEGKRVLYLEYEAYPSLALNEMNKIAEEAATNHSLHYISIVHHTGQVKIGETAVSIKVLAPHRAEAFAGCRFIIDEIKVRVPIWKHEFYADGHAHWVLCSHHLHGNTAHPNKAIAK